MTKFAVKNPVTILVLAAILLLAGALSYLRLPRESFPEIKIPLIFTTVIYPGASPEDMEKLVTEKIEDKLEGLDGLKKVSSVSGEGYSSIQVEFNANVAVETALRRVKDKVDQARPELPADVEEPVVQELNFSNIPIFVLSLSADYEAERLDEVAENLKDRIAAVPGVLEARLTGKREREIAIDADPARLRQYGLSLNDLVVAVQTQHRNIPGGTLTAGGNRFSVKLTGEVQSPEKFGDLIVRARGTELVRMRDVAAVSFQYARDQSTIFRLNGRNSLAVSVTKRVGANILDVVDEAKKVVEETRPAWPLGTSVDYTMDQSTEIRHIVSELQNHILLGIIFVILTLSFFLGLRNSLFISTAIPFSMMIGFLVLETMGVTLNMVVLFSLIIALGMLVDDGIVVVENIYRHLQMGKDRATAAIDGTREVMIPVTTATITTVVAFLPIVFMPGIMGQFMKYLPITVMVTMTGSLFVAFVFNPVFASLFMSGGRDGMKESGAWFERFKGVYRRFLDRAVDHPLLVIGFCFLFVISSFFAYGALGKGVVFFPLSEPKVVAVEVTGPLGVDLATTEAALKEVERKLFTIPEDQGHVESFSTIVGLGKAVMGGDLQPESHKGYVDVSFVDYEKRRVPSWTSMQWMQENVPIILPGWQVAVKKQEDGPPQGYPVSFEISGAEFAVLSALSDSVSARLARVPGLVNVNTDYEPVRPEISITVDREQARQLGVSTSEVALAVRGAIQGFEAGKYRVGKEEHEIMVRLRPSERESFAGLDHITVPGPEEAQIPLTSLARTEQKASLASIRHLDGKRTIQVWAELAPGTVDESKPKAGALAAVQGLVLPSGYSLQTGGSNRDQEESEAFLGLAFLIAVSLVVLTMVAQFNSISQPLMVFVGILLSVGGVFYGLVFMRVTFSIMMTGIGIIALAGVVAKNGIVLIDFINHLRKEGRPLREAVIEGGATRLRPVLLTAIAAMIALVPMATGKGFDFTHFHFIWRSESGMWWAPLAWAIFWGLFFNTILTLIAVPTLYYNWEKFKARMAKRFGGKTPVGVNSP